MIFIKLGPGIDMSKNVMKPKTNLIIPSGSAFMASYLISQFVLALEPSKTLISEKYLVPNSLPQT